MTLAWTSVYSTRGLRQSWRATSSYVVVQFNLKEDTMMIEFCTTSGKYDCGLTVPILREEIKKRLNDYREKSKDVFDDWHYMKHDHEIHCCIAAVLNHTCKKVSELSFEEITHKALATFGLQDQPWTYPKDMENYLMQRLQTQYLNVVQTEWHKLEQFQEGVKYAMISLDEGR